MQRNDIIIKEFVKTIKESPLAVEGDPVLLSKVFEALEKKKKRRRFIAIFLFISIGLVGSGFVIRGLYLQNDRLKENKEVAGSSKHLIAQVQNEISTLNDLKEKKVVPPTEEIIITPKKRTYNRKNVISYKSKSHQIDIVKGETEEFIQINVFGVDGAEKDFLKIIEDLKKSYQNNEFSVDSVKHQ